MYKKNHVLHTMTFFSLLRQNYSDRRIEFKKNNRSY